MQLDDDTLRCSYINTNTVTKALPLYLLPKKFNPRAYENSADVPRLLRLREGRRFQEWVVPVVRLLRSLELCVNMLPKRYSVIDIRDLPEP
jgi:hypothetical protein